MQHNPFAGIRFQAKEVVKEILTKEEIEILLRKDFESERLNIVRDTFLFSVFTGFAYIDVYNLRAQHISTDHHGKQWIRKTREKTDNMCNIPLLEIPRLLYRALLHAPAVPQKWPATTGYEQPKDE